MTKAERARRARRDFETASVTLPRVAEIQALTDAERETRLRKALQDLDQQRKDAQ